MAVPAPDFELSAAAGVHGATLTGGAHTGPAAIDDLALQVFSVGGSGRLRMSSEQAPLGQSFTVCCWVRRLEAGKVPDGDFDSVLLGDDNSHWLAFDKDGRAGVVHKGGDAALSTEPLATGSWSFVAIVGGPDGTSVAAATAARPALRQLAAGTFSLAGSKLRTMGWAKSALQVSIIKCFARALAPSELHSVFAEAAGLHKVEPQAPELPTEPEEEPVEVKENAVRGRTICDGQPVEGVSVDADGAPCTTTTNAAGSFELELEEGVTSPGKLTFRKAGYAPCTLDAGDSLDVGEVALRAIAVEATLKAKDGGTVSDPASGSSVILKPGSLCYPDGRPFEGTARVQLCVIDPSDRASLASMPGDFTATTTAGEAVTLQSLGAMYVGLADEDGEELACSPGQGMTLDLKTPPTSFDYSRSERLPSVYVFNEASGKWEEEPEAELEVGGRPMPSPERQRELESTGRIASERAEVRSYRAKKKYSGPRAQVEDFSGTVLTKESFAEMFKEATTHVKMEGITKSGWWNCDAPYRASLLSGQLLPAGRFAGAVVWSVGTDYSGRSRSIADEDGCFSVMAQCLSTVELEVTVKPPEEELLRRLQAQRAFNTMSWSSEEAGADKANRTELLRAMRGDDKKFTFGPFITRQPGEVTNVGILRALEE